MSVHLQAHVQVKAPTVRANIAVKAAPIVREHRGEPIQSRPRPIIVHGYQQPRPVIVHETVRPIIYNPAPTYYTTAVNYTYQPAIQVMNATALDGQLAVNVDGLGSARTLELDAAGGQTFVSQVTVYNANGSYQTIPVNQMLSAQNPTASLAIDNCAGITQIVVDGHSNWGGELAIRAF
ncbi:MAG: hypothetical protein QM831_17050 [Kofleriaceae bacterium]